MAKQKTKSTAKARAKRKKIASKKGLMLSIWYWLRWPLGACCAAFLVWVLILDDQVRAKFDGRKWALPAHVYAQPLELYQGLRLSALDFEAELQALSYRPVSRVTKAGQYGRQRDGDVTEYQVFSRGFAFSDGVEVPLHFHLRLRGQYVELIEDHDGRLLSLLRLEPVEIGGIYPAHREDRQLVQLRDLPTLLGEALIAVEDRNFLDHYGLSPKSIARAAVANLKAGRVVQGGSTLTQQLVKNFYLSRERSLTRKIREALMSLLLELHYSKSEILETYINEIYLGQSGQRAIHGFALAAQHYFSRSIKELNTGQVALLIGLVKGASHYNPWRHPERARARRNIVLMVMRNSGLIDAEEYQRVSAGPLGVVSAARARTEEYPAFLGLVKRQLLRDYREQDLSSEGLRIFTSFSLRAQRRAERAVSRRLPALEKQYQLATDTLQAAVVLVAVGSGEVQALIGGRHEGYQGFNRALDARRSIGSLVKPALYLTAIEQGYNLSSELDDEAVTVRGPGGKLWQPQNFDHKSHGRIPLFRALAFSYNQAAARLGMQLGLSKVAQTLEDLGVESDVAEIPAMLLGAVEWPPISVAAMYHTIATDGFYTPLRAIRNVQTALGKPLSRYPLAVEQRFQPASVFQLKAAMQQVMRVGSGRGAYRHLPKELVLAGKTGTSNDQRDSWFAGFSGDKLAVVWVGRDDNGATPLTGASGALPLWAQIMAGDPGRSLQIQPPAGLKNVWVDASSGYISGDNCRGALQLPFVVDNLPTQKGSCEWIENPLKHWWKNL